MVDGGAERNSNNCALTLVKCGLLVASFFLFPVPFCMPVRLRSSVIYHWLFLLGSLFLKDTTGIKVSEAILLMTGFIIRYR